MKAFINFLPQVIFYFIPGAFFFGVFNFITNKKDKEYKYYIFKSIIISYILNRLYFCTDIFKLHLSTNINILFTLFISVILAYLVSLIIKSLWFNKLLMQLNIYRNLKTNFWNDVFDYKNGNYIAVYLKNEELIYYGTIVKHDENKGKCFVMLENYIVYNYEGDKINKEDVNNKVVLFLDESSRIEIIYSPKSKI